MSGPTSNTGLKAIVSKAQPISGGATRRERSDAMLMREDKRLNYDYSLRIPPGQWNKLIAWRLAWLNEILRYRDGKDEE